MKRTLVGLASLVLLGVAVAWSGPKPARSELEFSLDKQNPVTHLRLANDPDEFQFAIVSDRTGGHRARVFSRAIDQLNLLQPEFVMSVGDLIEGYTQDKLEINRQWREFQGYTSRLQMPFFYVPGNHDKANPAQATFWNERFGRSYYEFLYRDVLFVVLDTEDPPEKNDSGRISEQQLEWLKKTLAKHASVRWTLVFLHKPVWLSSDSIKTGWPEAEKLLEGRKYTVFAGHVHRYEKFTRSGQNYYMLGTTGGDSRLRGTRYGEVDHFVWVTMKKSGPVLANILLDGVIREDLSNIPSEEEGVTEYYRRPTHPASVTVTLDGRPLEGAYVVFQSTTREPRRPRADGTTDAEGKARLSTYKAFDGVPAGDFAVTVELRKPEFTPEGKRGRNLLPAKYATVETTPLLTQVRANGKNDYSIDLSSK